MQEIPFYRGQKKYAEAEKLKNVAFSSIMCISLAAVLLLMAIVFFVKRKIFDEYPLAWACLALIMILQQGDEYVRRYLSAVERFKEVNFLKIIRACVIGLLIVLLVRKFSFMGIIFAFLMGHLLTFTYAFARRFVSVSLDFDMAKTAGLIKTGALIALIDVFYNFYQTFDRLFVLRFLGKAKLGYYSVAATTFDYFGLIPSAMGLIIYIYLAKIYGEKKEIGALKENTRLYIYILSYLLACFLPVAFIFLPYAIRIILPSFASSITAAQIAIFGSLPISISIVSGYFLLVIHRMKAYLLMLCAAIFLKSGAIYFVIAHGGGLNDIALVSVYLYILHSLIIFFYSYSLFDGKRAELLKVLLRIYLPFFYVVCVTACLGPLLELIRSHVLGVFGNPWITNILLCVLISFPLGVSLIDLLKKERASIAHD